MSNIGLIITAIFYVLLCVILIYRVAVGPHAVDRVISADSLDGLTVIIMVLFGAISNRAIYLDLALIIALLGFLSTVFISRYLEGKL
jgi:multisubunit Na+/H+ antiporter MnhF subunit